MPDTKDVTVFSPNMSRIVSRFDNVLMTQDIAQSGWWIGEDGRLRYEFDESAPEGGDGGDQPATRDGFTLYRDAAGETWAENELLVFAVGEKGQPAGAAIPFKAERLRGAGVIGKDDALLDLARNLLEAARAVVGAWEKGDLAGAVNALEGEAEAMAELLGLADEADESEGAEA